MFEQFLPLLFLLLLFAVLRWSQGKASEDPKTSESALPSQPDSMRKLMEALGLPEDAVPPPILPKKQTLTSEQKSSLPKLPLPPKAVSPKSPKLSVSARNPVIAKTETSAELATAHHLSVWLRQPASLKRAMVLKEILDPPKASGW